jgi:hypothetical protein
LISLFDAASVSGGPGTVTQMFWRRNDQTGHPGQPRAI